MRNRDLAKTLLEQKNLMSKCRCEKVDEKDDMRKKSMRKTRWVNSDQTKNLLSTCRKASRNINLLLSAQCVPNHWK